MILQRGFTLIEVLISMVILAIGLLGLAAMQAISLRDNQDAYYYQQATLLAYEMQDRIRGNVYWANNTVTAATNVACNNSQGCSAKQMAENDYDYWQNSVEAIFPKPKTGEAVEISHTAQANTPCAIITGTALCLITRWGRTNSKDVGVLSKDSTFYLKVTP